MNLTLKITLVSSVLFFIYTLINFLNGWHYCRVYCLPKPTAHLLENYSYCPLLPFERRVVIPLDKPKSRKTLVSLLLNTVRASELALHYEPSDPYLKTVATIYPQSHHMEQQLYPTLLREKNNNVHVLLFLHDTCLPPDYLENLSNVAKKHCSCEKPTVMVHYKDANQWVVLSEKQRRTHPLTLESVCALFIPLDTIDCNQCPIYSTQQLLEMI